MRSAAALVVLFVAAPAGAERIGKLEIAQYAAGTKLDFAQSRTETSRIPLAWRSSCIFLTPDAGGSTHIAGDGELQVIERSMAAWNDATGGCSFVHFEILPPKPVPGVQYDGTSGVIFVESDWCELHENRPGCASMTALTTLYYIDEAGSPNEGQILEADVELNGDDFATRPAARASASPRARRARSRISRTP